MAASSGTTESDSGSGSVLPARDQYWHDNQDSDSCQGSDDQSQDNTTPPRKRKKYSCVFRKEHTKIFSWATASKKGPTYAFCVKCSRDISLGLGGTKDLKRHEQTALHGRCDRAGSSCMNLQSYFSGPPRAASIVEAEVKFGYMLGEHHLPFLLADHCTKLFQSMFPDSAIAKAFKCSRTKATAILKLIALDVLQQVKDTLQESKFFSIQVDESTDISVSQQMAVMLRLFDNTSGCVRCVFFALESVEQATAEVLFQAIHKHFQLPLTLSYSNLVGLGTDGANVMLGRRNSVFSRLQAEQPSLVAIHCNCHIAALIANACCKVLPDNLEELTTDIFYYFKKSPKRIREFEKFQAFVEAKPHKLLKSCQTRWLSLEACVNRLIEQYQALLSYFRSTEDRQAVVRRVKAVLEAPLTQAYLRFLSSALPIIINFNKLMQRESPVVHVLQQELNGFIQKILLRFMKPDYVLSFSSALEVDIVNDYFLPLDEVFLGDATLQYIESTDEITTSELRKFQETCLCWWTTAAKEALRRLPIDHPLLSNIKWLQPCLQQYSLANQVQASAKVLQQVVKSGEIPVLLEEFMDYCVYPLSPAVKSIIEIDRYWYGCEQNSEPHWSNSVPRAFNTC